MDVRQLRYFLSVAEHESFSRAAAVLRVAQPALSRQIQHLEAELGVQLLSRHARGVYLTAAGKILRERASHTLKQIEETRRELLATATDAVGRVHLGMPPSLRDIVTLPLVKTFRRECPAVFLKVMEATSMMLNDSVSAGDLDLAVVGNLEPDAGLESVPVAQERLFLVGPPGFAQDLRQPPELAILADTPLILTSRPNTLRMLVENAASKRGLTLRVVMEADHFPLVLEMVRDGLGFTITPYSACAAALRDGAVNGIPLKGLFITWTLINRRERVVSVAARRMKDVLHRSIGAALAHGDWTHANVWPGPALQSYGSSDAVRSSGTILHGKLAAFRASGA